MLHANGEALLKAYADRSFPPTVTEIEGTVYHVLGVGHSSASFIIGDTSVILVDTLDSLGRGHALRDIIAEVTDKPVKTIIFTHGHPDHRGGAGAFDDTVEEIIAFSGPAPLGRTATILPELNRRTVRQFGYALNDDKLLCQGIGIREGWVQSDDRPEPRPATTLYHEDEVRRTIDSVSIELRRIPGETDDQILVWLPDLKTLCCGDTYYGCFPNLYALRGSQYRDVNQWVASLDILRSYDAEALLPGHTRPVLGKTVVQDTLTNYRDALESVLTQTLDGLAAGKTMAELAAEVRLPEHLAELPYLGEHYGSVEWSVKGIYSGYVGWFDGNATNLHPLAPSRRAQKSIALMGGADAVLVHAREALDDDTQWCLELCDLLLHAKEQQETARLLKADACERLAPQETSANGRHYYYQYAQELRDGSVGK